MASHTPQQNLTPPAAFFTSASQSTASMDRYREHKHFALLKTIIIDECKARRALGSHQSIRIKTDMAVFSGGRPGASSIQYSCDLILRDDVAGIHTVMKRSVCYDSLIDAMEALWREARIPMD